LAVLVASREHCVAICHHSRAVPTYDYQCRSCGTVTEVIHSMLDDGPSVCELCGGALRRVIYPSGIIFKGSGFYRTDSRASSTGSSGGSDTGATTASGGESGTGRAGGISRSDKGSSGAKKQDTGSPGSTTPAGSD
jgi:putative FmdB family regulatory protein